MRKKNQIKFRLFMHELTIKFILITNRSYFIAELLKYSVSQNSKCNGLFYNTINYIGLTALRAIPLRYKYFQIHFVNFGSTPTHTQGNKRYTR
jgi:hypothetical protein